MYPPLVGFGRSYESHMFYVNTMTAPFLRSLCGGSGGVSSYYFMGCVFVSLSVEVAGLVKQVSRAVLETHFEPVSRVWECASGKPPLL